MYMKDTEIISKYTRADDKKNQLEVLADLNGCDTDAIRAVLRKGGVPEDRIWNPTKRGPRKKRSERTEEAAAPAPEETIPGAITGGEGDIEGYEPTTAGEAQRIIPMSEIFDENPSLTPEQQAQVDRALAIPLAVRDACQKELDFLTVQVVELEKKRDEISDYLQGVLK